MQEGYFLSFLGAMIAGFINSCVSLPIDIAKTRLQNMKVTKLTPSGQSVQDGPIHGPQLNLSFSLQMGNQSTLEWSMF